MQLNDRVEWTSQAAGIETRKVGVIVEVVPPNHYPKTKRGGIGAPRNHESYVVRVTQRGGKRISALYWPLVSHLRPATNE
jgi:hypothetical protein